MITDLVFLTRKPAESTAFTITSSDILPIRVTMPLARDITVVDLPHEVLSLVFFHLSGAEIKRLSCVSWGFRLRTLPHLFGRIHGTWEKFLKVNELEEEFDGNCGKSSKAFAQFSEELGQFPGESSTEYDCKFPWRNYVREIRISSPEPKYEYQTNSLNLVLKPWPMVDQVMICTASLSFWVKNHSCPKVRLVLLYLAKVTRGDEKLFHLSHLDNFHGLRNLYLHNYNFRWGDDDAMPLSKLDTLTLDNCTWDYPFNLASFNQYDTLRCLVITYSHDNTFVLSERYVDYLRNPFQGHLSSLGTVSLSFVNTTQYKGILTPTILHNFLECFVGLSELKLKGWSTNLDSLRRVLVSRTYLNPFKLQLEIELVDAINVSSFLHFVKRPNLDVNVNIIT